VALPAQLELPAIMLKTLRRNASRLYAARRFFVVSTLGLALVCGSVVWYPRQGSAPDPSTPAARRTLHIAAAADLQAVFPDLLAAFAPHHTDIDVMATFGSSGDLCTKLENRAPFDLFLSADLDYPRRLVDKRLARREALFEYAVGHLVLWVRNDSGIDVETKGIQALLAPSIRKIAIANPRYAPYGRSAEAALRSLGVYDQVKDRLVLGDNIGQTAQFVQAGAADIGLIALTQAHSPKMRDNGRFWNVPLEAYPRLEQGGVVLEWGRDSGAAEAFSAFLQNSEGKEILQRYGFYVPEK
jgi:molybdate transport system substrate-binding protein